MLVKNFKNCKEEIIAADGCRLRELLSYHNDEVECRYSIAYAGVAVGEKTIPHALKTTEVYYILRGKGLMHIEDKEQEVSLNDVIYIPPAKAQWIENIGEEDLEFLCIVDPAWRIEDEISLN